MVSLIRAIFVISIPVRQTYNRREKVMPAWNHTARLIKTTNSCHQEGLWIALYTGRVNSLTGLPRTEILLFSQMKGPGALVPKAGNQTLLHYIDTTPYLCTLYNTGGPLSHSLLPTFTKLRFPARCLPSCTIGNFKHTKLQANPNLCV